VQMLCDSTIPDPDISPSDSTGTMSPFHALILNGNLSIPFTPVGWVATPEAWRNYTASSLFIDDIMIPSNSGTMGSDCGSHPTCSRARGT
jgi:hypothetical protein